MWDHLLHTENGHVKTTQINRLAALRRVQAFLDQHSNLFGHLHGSRARRVFDDAMKLIAELAQEKRLADDTHRFALRLKRKFRERLVKENMRPISAVARVWLRGAAYLPKLVLTRSTPADRKLIARAMNMATTAARRRRLFTGEGCPADFVEQLRSAANTLAEVLDACDANAVRRRDLTRQLGNAFAPLAVALPIIDAAVVREIHQRPELLSAWRFARATHVKEGAGEEAQSAPGRSAT